ncbi:hypothetical protein SAMN04487949_3377 [Halogranum gelatinilyticum]|uniref:Small CPxCG-related zinc finger protein n=1 Tax=Halogranum gelatinilyticum TaxID=660521 RepID=A0A1G9YMF9_9EURY|nr:hypothetical protein SAMN04487949_3377 [Halogranum gelatinilyticum]
MRGQHPSDNLTSFFVTEASVSRQFVFTCPECALETDVDGDIRAELLEDGCLLCDASVTTDAFSPLTGTSTR